MPLQPTISPFAIGLELARVLLRRSVYLPVPPIPVTVRRNSPLHETPLNGPMSKPQATSQPASLPLDAPTETSTSSPPSALSLDELSNTLTHGLGFLLSLGAVVFFWRATANLALGLRICCLLFAFSMAIVYLFSTLSHAVQSPRLRSRMRAWDQGTIYLLIAGTYSPFIWQGSPPGWTLLVMGSVWLAATWGFYLKVVAKYRIEASSTVTYVLLGWIPAIVLFARTPTNCVLWMVAGGLSYTLGILFLIRSHHAWYTHSLWHLAVIGGSTCHFIAVWNLLPPGL